MFRYAVAGLAVGYALLVTGCSPVPTTTMKVAEADNITDKAVWPRISSFIVSSDNISPGENVTLKWDTSGGDSVTITPAVGRVEQRGSTTVFPSVTTRYELAVSNSNGRSVGWITVTVNVPPVLLPDLIITGVTYNSGLLYYTVKNIGTKDAGPHNTWLYDMSHMQRDQSWVSGLKVGEEKRGEFSNFQYTGNPVTICADGGKDVDESNEDNNCYVPTWGIKFNYDMQQYASRAGWRSSAGNVAFGEKSVTATGMVNRAGELLMEDGKSYRNVIEAVPPPESYSWIEGQFGETVEQWNSGSYMIPMELPNNARFTARVGLAKDAQGGGGVSFSFGLITQDGRRNFWPAVKAAYDGRLDSFDIDLNSYAGKKVMAILRVEAGADADRNHAAWIATANRIRPHNSAVPHSSAGL